MQVEKYGTFNFKMTSEQMRPYETPINLFRNMRWKGIKCQISQARNKLIKDKLYCSFLIKISRSVHQFMALF